MVYNLTGIVSNSGGILSLTQGVNTVLMGGWFGTLILLGLTVVFFTSFMFTTNDTNKSIAATAFISFTLAILLRVMVLISDLTLIITLIAAAGALAVSFKH